MCPSVCPVARPRYRGFDSLEQMLRHTHHSVDVVYYEVLDLPLPALEQLKTLKVRGTRGGGGPCCGSREKQGRHTGGRALWRANLVAAAYVIYAVWRKRCMFDRCSAGTN